MIGKKFKLLLSGIACSVLTYAQGEQDLALLVTKTDGAKVGYCLNEFPALVFEENGLRVSCKGISEVFALNEVSSLSYVKESNLPAGIEKGIEMNFSAVFYNSGIIVWKNSNDKVVICDVTGKTLYSGVTNACSPLFIDKSTLSHGINILKCANQSLKFYVE